MKKENDTLHPSRDLANHFASYRDEKPLLSANEIDQLLQKRDMLPNQSLTTKTVRRIIMSTIGVAGVGVLLYFGMIGGGQKSTPTHHVSAAAAVRSTPVKKSVLASANSPVKRIEEPDPTKPEHANSPRTDTRGPWSASGDQYYIDLTEDQLAKIGVIVTKDDTVRSYHSGADSKPESWDISAHSVGGGNATPPQSIHVPNFYPVLATFDNGQGVAYQIHEGGTNEWGMVGSNEMMEKIREWLGKPGVPGYYALGINSITQTGNDHVEHDTVTIRIAKDFPPRMWPFMRQHIGKLPDSVVDAIMQLAHYYDGSLASKPTFAWPKTLTTIVDTLTVKDLLREIDQEENSATVQHLRSAMAHLNELVPVLVHTHGEGKDFILWYKPSDELLAALPAKQVKAFREHSKGLDHCLAAPSTVVNTAEITYCMSEAQQAEILVRDLTGRVLMVVLTPAHAGDNVLKLSTETLRSGMYIVTVRSKDSSEQSRRIWVENASPKERLTEIKFDSAYGQQIITVCDTASANSVKDFVNKLPAIENVDMEKLLRGDTGELATRVRKDVRNALRRLNAKSPALQQAVESIEKNNSEALGISYLELLRADQLNLGIESNDIEVRYYVAASDPKELSSLGIERSWGAIIGRVLRSDVKHNVPDFSPTLVTDGLGRKRLTNITDPSDTLVNALVPLLFRASGSQDSIGARDLIFWYKPTADFLALLPDSIRQQVLVQTTKDGTDPRKALAVEAARGAIKAASIYPNPSRGGVTVNLSLASSRTLTFTLRNLLGQAVGQTVQAQASGSAQQKLDFSGVTEGIYLLDITSDAGERYIQRLVIQR